MSNFVKIPEDAVKIEQQVKQLKQSGNLVYEYNPLKVLRVNEDVLSEDGSVTIPKNSIIDLNTKKLAFDLNHPVDIVTQQSYDGSVNLILNDGKNPPKLINSRFSTTGLNTYQIVDREGDNDSNIYDENNFDSESSLYKNPNSIVKLDFIGLGTNGNLKVGNYVFYFKLADSDGNETDIIAESGIVSCHLGNINDPFSINGGLENENSFKSVNFILSNIDSSYDHVTVYYTRNSAGIDGGDITLGYKVYEKYPIYNQIAKVNITGFEKTVDISIDELNTQYNLVSNAKTQTVCQNMLFLGNVSHENILYKELADLSLYFLPKIQLESIGYVDENYEDKTRKYEYYNANNIYNKLGYWNDEIYRFGVVYILPDYSLSPVFNVRGIDILNEKPAYSKDEELSPGDKNNRTYIEIDKTNYKISGTENSKGVCHIKLNDSRQFNSDDTKAIGIKFELNNKAAKTLLKEHGIKGWFFVRQKRIKTTFCQAITIGYDKINYCPTIPISEDNYLEESFISNNRNLTHDFNQRIRLVQGNYVSSGTAAICPEYELNQPFYNQFFTGTEFIINPIAKGDSSVKSNVLRSYYININSKSDSSQFKANIIGVSDNIKAVRGKNLMFSSRAGEAEEAAKFAFMGYLDKANSKATNIMRGAFGPYIGLESLNNIENLTLVDIKIPGYNETLMEEYFNIRYRDNSSFSAISDRYSIDDYKDPTIFRGDCYICNFTHRMIRNFQDPEFPINDVIVESDTWKENYTIDEEEDKKELINRSDVNAVKIGHWITFKCCSSINLSLRTTNPYYPTEKGLTGRVRGFYPLQAIDASGESKIPESELHNSGYNKTIGDKYYFETPNVPSIKNKFHTRILYSDIAINDAFKNGFRVFRNLNYRDYPLTYGSLTKIVEWYGSIICIFEHGIATIPVNERAVAAQSSGGNVFINTSTVLPETPNIISDMFGSQWAESVVQTTYGIYGVDTVAKKIWKIKVNQGIFQLSVISDFKVQKFLNKSISLSEQEVSPIIGIRNVKTHYNAFKNDVMFTFYDDINTIEETAWNLCYNEVLERFITFYSWIPSYSANIDNIFFTFDRDTSKNISKLFNTDNKIKLSSSKIINDNKKEVKEELEDYTSLGNLICEGETISYSLIEDLHNGIFLIRNSELFVKTSSISTVNPIIWVIPIRAEITNSDETVQIIEDKLVLYNKKYLENLEKTSFWKHGQSGLMKTTTNIKPCNWYGKQHPFEFEFIVVDNPTNHKIFTNLQIISNKVAPESLHFEISGEVYNFADDKQNMFFRQEAIKNLYQYLGGDILYDKEYLNIAPKQRIIPYSSNKGKSTMFPLYFSKVNTINEIENYYQSKSDSGKDYQRISGSEIIYDKTTNQYNIATHIKACPFGGYYKKRISESRYNELKNLNYHNIICTGINTKTKVEEEVINIIGSTEYADGVITYTDGNSNYSDLKYYEIEQYGRLNGNMHFKEDGWSLQIPSIVYWQKNEDWKNDLPPLNIANNPLPESMPGQIEVNSLPKNLEDLGYKIDMNFFDNSIWKDTRKETRIRDRYLKVKIRYTGSDLAIINAIKTAFTITYA